MFDINHLDVVQIDARYDLVPSVTLTYHFRNRPHRLIYLEKERNAVNTIIRIIKGFAYNDTKGIILISKESIREFWDRTFYVLYDTLAQDNGGKNSMSGMLMGPDIQMKGDNYYNPDSRETKFSDGTIQSGVIKGNQILSGTINYGQQVYSPSISGCYMLTTGDHYKEIYGSYAKEFAVDDSFNPLKITKESIVRFEEIDYDDRHFTLSSFITFPSIDSKFESGNSYYNNSVIDYILSDGTEIIHLFLIYYDNRLEHFNCFLMKEEMMPQTFSNLEKKITISSSRYAPGSGNTNKSNIEIYYENMTEDKIEIRKYLISLTDPDSKNVSIYVGNATILENIKVI